MRDLHDILRLRCEVFVVEQACAFAEIDGRDPAAIHCLARGGDGTLLGTLRILPPEADGAPVRIGRVATTLGARGQGLGRALMVEALEEARRRFGAVPVEVGAQTRLARFYASLGFVRTSPDRDEDGIPHCTMVRAG